jgi:hypothetical protein
LFVDASGNVGVGAAAAASINLDVFSTGTTVVRSYAGAGSQAYLSAAGNAGTVGTSSFDIIQDATSIAYLYQRANQPLLIGTNNTERLRIDSSGNVGIGTTSPARPLDVNGTVRVSDGGAVEWGGTSAYIAGTSASNALLFNTANTERARIDSSGNVGIGTSSPGVKLHIADGQIKVANSGAINPTIAFTGNGAGASGFQVGQRYNAQELFIYDLAALADRVVVDSAGRVGIGTASPTMLLDINNDTVRVRTARTPASASAQGATGEICWDANYIYVCTATNTWKRSAISTW